MRAHMPFRGGAVITIKIDVNGKEVSRISAVRTKSTGNKDEYWYDVRGWTTNYKKGKRYMLFKAFKVKQHGSSPLFVSELMKGIDEYMQAMDEVEGET